MLLHLNSYDKDGNAVDTDHVDIDDETVEAIIDRATDVILARRHKNASSLDATLRLLDLVLDGAGII